MASLVSVAFNGPVARIPNPPAFETVATNSGVDIQDIPGSRMGYWHPNNLVMRVWMGGNRVNKSLDADDDADGGVMIERM